MDAAVTRRFGGEDGTTLIEVVVASAILVTLMAGLMSLAGLAISTTENQGHLAARTTEYAQDKMEQLLSLQFSDSVTDTRTFPASASGGTGLVVGGSSNPDAPAAGYVDYLDDAGNLCGTTGAACAAPSGTTAPAGWFYKRVWAISSPATNLKQITVSAATARGFGGGNKAVSYLAVLKSYPF
jgi:type II secretory pathway pseudopilin PulG